MSRSRILVVALALLFSDLGFSQETGGRHTPGGVILLPVFSEQRPSLRFGLERLAVVDTYAERGIWVALVGVDMLTEPGDYLVTREWPGKVEDELLFVSVKPTEQKLEPSQDVTSRIEEYLRDALSEEDSGVTIDELIGDWNGSKLFSLPFYSPMDSGLADRDTFGVYVRYPSGALEPVDSIIYRTDKIRMPVVAPSGATVHEIIEPEDDDGEVTMVLNHGQGIFSILRGSFMAQIGVGEVVQAAQLIGLYTLGDRRAATDGIHELSWQVIMNGDLIDPSQLLELELESYLDSLKAPAAEYFAERARQQAEEQARLAAVEQMESDLDSVSDTGASVEPTADQRATE